MDKTTDTVAFVQEWLMNADYDPLQFDRDFAAAIDARVIAVTAANLAEAFCATPLPDDVCADLCATVQGPGRYGTNLLTVAQAERTFAAILSTPSPDSGERMREADGTCSLGVGCEQAGVCYADAHGQPEQCDRASPMPARSDGSWQKALEASLAKRSQGGMDPPWTAAFNAALDMVAKDMAPHLTQRPPEQAGAVPAGEADRAELIAYLANPPRGGNHYVGSSYSVARMKEAAALLSAAPTPPDAGPGEIPAGMVATKSPYDRDCHFCGLGWTGAHKHGCPRAMEDYSGGPADD